MPQGAIMPQWAIMPQGAVMHLVHRCCSSRREDCENDAEMQQTETVAIQ